jgi:hypothetical protein
VGESLITALGRDLPLRPALPIPPSRVILSAEVRRGPHRGHRPGPLMLERERAGAAPDRRVGLPILVTGGSFKHGEPPVTRVVALSLAEDFRAPVRWVEPEAQDTWRKREGQRGHRRGERYPLHLFGDPRLEHAAGAHRVRTFRHQVTAALIRIDCPHVQTVRIRPERGWLDDELLRLS